MNTKHTLFAMVLAVLALASCTSTKKVAYLKNIGNEVIDSLPEVSDPLIQKNDILSISVSSLNPEASAVFNMPNLPSSGMVPSTTGSLTQTVGYLVNSEGNIQFPMLGTLKAAGRTRKQLTDDIDDQITSQKLLKDPIITIRQLNFHVTVIGEVAHPMVVSVPNEKINIMEAIGMAGDLTIYAKRENVLLVREENGVRATHRLDLNSTDLLRSPYYNLESGDIVYAEPNKAKINSTSNTRQVLPMVLSGLSFVAILIDRLVK
jgi:polysaccharide export outer membrane protein